MERPMMEAVRECRLRPEFAHLYEELTPAMWVPAQEGAERLVPGAQSRRDDYRAHGVAGHRRAGMRALTVLERRRD